MEKTKEILEYNIALRDSLILEKGTWFKALDMLPLSAPLGDILSNTL